MNANASSPKHLRTLLGDHPQTAALKAGKIASDRIVLDFASYSPTHKGFKPMVREQAFDVSEMAIVTYLIAKSFDKPMVLLPAVVMGRFQHRYALVNAERALSVSDLAGKRVGIRSFTTTTGAWVRGILANDYGVDLDVSTGCRSRSRMSPNMPIRRFVRRRPRTSSRCCWMANWTP